MRSIGLDTETDAREKGLTARLGGCDKIVHNPYPKGECDQLRKSFIAGWEQADRDIRKGLLEPFPDRGTE